MNPSQLPKSFRNPLNRDKRDYQGNHEVFEMPEEQKPDAPKSNIPFGRIAQVIVGIVLVVFVVVIIFSMLSNSNSFL